jgi:hypothetical protein
VLPIGKKGSFGLVRFPSVLCDVISVVTELMVSAMVWSVSLQCCVTEFIVRVRVRVRVRVAACGCSPSVIGRNLQFQLVRGSEHPRGMALVARLPALQAEEQRREPQWHPRECKFPSKTRTIQQPQPDDGANPNAAESMVVLTLTQQNPWCKGGHRTQRRENKLVKECRHFPSVFGWNL